MVPSALELLPKTYYRSNAWASTSTIICIGRATSYRGTQSLCLPYRYRQRPYKQTSGLSSSPCSYTRGYKRDLRWTIEGPIYGPKSTSTLETVPLRLQPLTYTDEGPDRELPSRIRRDIHFQNAYSFSNNYLLLGGNVAQRSQVGDASTTPVYRCRRSDSSPAISQLEKHSVSQHTCSRKMHHKKTRLRCPLHRQRQTIWNAWHYCTSLVQIQLSPRRVSDSEIY